MARGLEREIGRLYGLPLDEFTEARNTLASTLAQQDPPGAQEVRRLPKPTLAVWTINQLARTEGPAVQRLLAAGAALRQAQKRALEGTGSSAALARAQGDEREALRELTSRARELLTAGGRRATAATLERISTTLSAAAREQSARVALKGGRLTNELQPPGFEALAGIQPRADRPEGAIGAERRRKQLGQERRRRELRSTWRELARAAGEAERGAARAEYEAAKKREAAEAARAAADRAADELAQVEQ